MKYVLLFLGLFFTVISVDRVFGTAPLRLSLKESVRIALLHNADVINARLNEKIQAQQKNLYVTEMLPQVKYNLQANYISPTRKSASLTGLLPPFISGLLTGVAAESPLLSLILNPDQGIFANFQNFTIQQLLFEPNLMMVLASLKNLQKLAEVNTQMAEETLKEQVMRLYFTLLILQQRKTIADTLYERAKALSVQTQSLIKNGFLESIDEERTQLNLNKAEVMRLQLQHSLMVAKAAFAQLTGISKDTSFVLEDDLAKRSEMKDYIDRGGADYTDRSDYKSLSIGYELKKLDLKSKKLAYLPTLVFVGTLGNLDISNRFVITSHLGKGGLASDFWGLRLSVDVFSGMKKRFDIKKARLELQQTENTLRQTRELINVDIERKQKNYLNAFENVKLWQRNKVLSERVWRQLQIRYTNGLASSMDMLTATSEWESVIDKYYEALLAFLLAQIEWKRAMGKIDSLL